MNVRLFVDKNYVLGFNIGLLMKTVGERERAVKQQQGLVQISILIGQLVTYFQNVIQSH